jgi:hypothetical protein
VRLGVNGEQKSRATTDESTMRDVPVLPTLSERAHADERTEHVEQDELRREQRERCSCGSVIHARWLGLTCCW